MIIYGPKGQGPKGQSIGPNVQWANRSPRANDSPGPKRHQGPRSLGRTRGNSVESSATLAGYPAYMARFKLQVTENNNFKFKLYTKII